MRPLLFVRLTYMDRYDGPGETHGGGSYITEHGVGGEVFNFKPYRGKCYGYGMTHNHCGVNLNFLDDNDVWSKGDELHDVDVVFIAKRPKVGQVIVGWYEGATVYHKQYRTRRGAIPGIDFRGISYFCDVDESGAKLLLKADRNFRVPLAAIDGKGFTGQANIWYPETARNLNASVKKFVTQVRAYIKKNQNLPSATEEGGEKKSKRGGVKHSGKPDAAHNAVVERMAVEFVQKNLKVRGFKVISVENENCGWDLIATKGVVTKYVEVKGQSGPSIYFELTPNEYSKLQLNMKQYSICVVCEVFVAPTLYEFLPMGSHPLITLKCIKPAITISLSPKTGAVGREEKTGIGN